MKKITLILYIGLVILFGILCGASYLYITYQQNIYDIREQEEQWNRQMDDAKMRPNFTCYDDTVTMEMPIFGVKSSPLDYQIEIENADPGWEDYLEDVIATFPVSVQKELADMKIIVTEDFLDTDGEYATLGYCDHLNHTIKITVFPQNLQYSGMNFAHEVGHLIMETHQNEIEKYYQTRSDLPDVYFHDSNRYYTENFDEWFAQCFVEYMYYRNNLRLSDEEFFIFYDNLLNN